MEFLAQMWSIRRDDEDNCRVTFATDSQQLKEVLSIPAQKLLKISIEIVDE